MVISTSYAPTHASWLSVRAAESDYLATESPENNTTGGARARARLGRPVAAVRCSAANLVDAHSGRKIVLGTDFSRGRCSERLLFLPTCRGEEATCPRHGRRQRNTRPAGLLGARLVARSRAHPVRSPFRFNGTSPGNGMSPPLCPSTRPRRHYYHRMYHTVNHSFFNPQVLLEPRLTTAPPQQLASALLALRKRGPEWADFEIVVARSPGVLFQARSACTFSLSRAVASRRARCAAGPASLHRSHASRLASPCCTGDREGHLGP